MATREILSGEITLEEAKAKSSNILHKLQYPSQRDVFFQRMEKHRILLHRILAHHFDVKTREITMEPRQNWLNGSFNLVIPFRIDFEKAARSDVPQFGVMRFPLPYRVGEATNPGNADEKLNCEAATYAWIQQNCPDVPIVRLFGFGLSTNQHFTSIELMSWWRRWLHHIQCFGRRVLGLQQPSRYLFHSGPAFLERMDTPYMILQAVDTGRMLSSNFKEKRDDPKLLGNLQCDLAKIMVSMASIPLPRIGSFRFDRNGFIRLDNRPLSVLFTMHENEDIPLELPRNTMFDHTDDFVLHHLTAFDNRLLHQPNAIDDESDAHYQMASLAAARLVFPQLLQKQVNQGPFALTLTDLHTSNIFVDEDWHIVSVIDLEFAGSLPLELVRTPYWLSGGLIDELQHDEFQPIHDEFIKHVQSAEQNQGATNNLQLLSSIMQNAWVSGAFWVSLAIEHHIAFTGIFYDRILGDIFTLSQEVQDQMDHSVFAALWRRNMSVVVDTKIEERKKYMEQLETAFTG